MLFAAALLWIVALVTWEPSDPVWFFSAGTTHPPANFAGLVGAFLAEASLQLLGYASYLIPATLVVVGWHYFWCRPVDAFYTKVTGILLLFGCVSTLFSIAIGNIDATIIAQAPQMARHIPAMRQHIAADIGIAVDAVNIKAKTAERLGVIGRGEGIAAEAIALIGRWEESL